MNSIAASPLRSALPLLDYAAFQATPLGTEPFPHVVVPNFVPPDPLAQVYADLPQLDRAGSFPPDALRLGPAARELVRELQGDAFREAIAGKFGLDLRDAPTMLTMRLSTRAKDGQIHTDSHAKRVTVLLYLNPPNTSFAQQDGCLRLLRGPRDLEDYAVEVPPTCGTLLVFPNGSSTWHGHRSYAGRRHSIQLNYMGNDGQARSELRRHKVSAFLKRFA